MISVKLRGETKERWVEGVVVEPGYPRLCSLDGVPVEANLAGTIVVTANDDRPGVIGDVGTMFGRHGVNIASFALGRSGATAVGVITVDEGVGLDSAVNEVRKLKAIREATIARV